MHNHTQELIKLFSHRNVAVIAAALMTTLLVGCNSSSTTNPVSMESLITPNETGTEGIGGNSDDLSTNNGTTDAGDEQFTCEDQSIPLAVTGIGSLEPMVLNRRAYARNYDAFYQSFYPDQPIPINRFVLTISVDWMQVQNATTNESQAVRFAETRSSCIGPYPVATQRLAALDVTSNAAFSAELPAGTSMADYVRVRTSSYPANYDLSQTSGSGLSYTSSFPIALFAKDLPTLTTLFSENQNQTLPDAPLQVVMALDFPMEWVQALDQAVDFTLTYSLEDGTTFTATSSLVTLQPAIVTTKIDEASWRMKRFTQADGTVLDDSDFYPEEILESGEQARADDYYQSLFLDFDYLTGSGAVDKLNITMPFSSCSLRVSDIEDTISIIDSLIEPDSPCNIGTYTPELMVDMAQSWLMVDPWSYAIENEVLTIRFGDIGVAEFSAWQ